ncbi:MAG: tyrosine-type recombinase/integrase [Muribaculaceae bacterium]|nr:tyrosine-type recombinase/integrase [Muribaculaceae bacterium]
MLIDRFLKYLSLELNRSDLTVEAYGRDLRQFSEWITGLSNDRFIPEDVSLSDIRAWLASLAREGVTPRSLRRKAQSIRAFFKYLLRQGIITTNPTADLTLPKLPKNLPDNIRTEEIESILSKEEIIIENDDIDDNENNIEEEIRSHLILEMLYSLGLRRAELIAISDRDISESSSEIKITGKRSKQRIVPVPAILLQHIARWQKLRDSLWPELETPRPLLVVKGKRITPSQVYYVVKKALAGTSARRKSPHALRHTFATAMLNEGADLNSVKEFLGHASLATTQIYTHISFAEMKKAYEGAHPRSKKTKF